MMKRRKKRKKREKWASRVKKSKMEGKDKEVR